MSLRKPLFGAALAAVIALVGASTARANSVTFTTTGSDGDGPLAATVVFTAANGGIQVVLTNTQSGTGFKRGQAISGLGFSVAGIAKPTLLSGLSGTIYNSASGLAWNSGSLPAFNDTTATDPLDHWGFDPSGSSILLQTVNAPGGTGNPHYMILPSSGTPGSGSSLNNGNFDPYIAGPATFFLTDASITAGTNFNADTLSKVSFLFGTGPDATTGTNGPPVIGSGPSTPLPASAWGGLTLMGGLLVGKRYLRKRRTA